MGVSTIEQRRSKRFTWTEENQGLEPGARPVRFTAGTALDVQNISAGGLLVRGSVPTVASLRVSVVGPGGVETSIMTLKTRSTTRGTDLAVLSVDKASRAKLQKVLGTFVSQHILRADGGAAVVLPQIPTAACGLETAQCPEQSHRCRCGTELPAVNLGRCDQCGHAVPYPNVWLACRPEQRAALKANLAKSAGAVTSDRLDWARATIADSVAVIACSSDVALAVLSGVIKYPSYHGLVQAGLRRPDGPGWAFLREVCDTMLFPGFKDEIRFAALSLDGRGVSRHGCCFITLKGVAERSSVFMSNSLYVAKKLRPDRAEKALMGLRASWTHRDDLVITKLGGTLGGWASPSREQLAETLLSDGTDPGGDEFVEIHVHGPFGPESFARVSVPTDEPQYARLEHWCQQRTIDFHARTS